MPVALVDNDADCCATLRLNRPTWNLVSGDIQDFSAAEFQGIDLLAGGVPCPPFSKAGRQQGGDDERDLFPHALRLVSECHPRAVMLENVRGFLDNDFALYRTQLFCQLEALGYQVHYRLLNASGFGVSQLRPRVVIVALRDVKVPFLWPCPAPDLPPTVGDALHDLMASDGWAGADEWRTVAHTIAPTLVGGSKKHGGPDLGPTRAKKSWATLGVNGHLIGNAPPPADFAGMPTLTVRMAARLQGFPDTWQFFGKKTSAYRQVGNAFPPPVAAAVAHQIARCLTG